MSKTASSELMELLHQQVASELSNRIKDGSASSADISNAIKFLKDNGIEARVEKNSALQQLSHSFPTFDMNEDHVN